jgi:hypothetical protein
MADTDWIKELKPGDEVIVECCGYMNFLPVEKVDDNAITVNGIVFDMNGVEIDAGQYLICHLQVQHRNANKSL